MPGNLGPHFATVLAAGHTGARRQFPDHQQATAALSSRIIDDMRLALGAGVVDRH